MSINKSYAVLGLGRYGISVAKELTEQGAEVLAVDKIQSVVNSLQNEIPFCKCADVTDSEVIERLGISNFDVAIICMAGSLEASVMAISLCKSAGVKNIIAKCGSELHGKIFLSVGADRVIFPEQESGVRLAKNLLSSGFIDMIELSKNISMVELSPKPEWLGKTLRELNLRKKHSLNVVAIKTQNNIQIDIDPELPLEENSKLIVIANTKKLEKLN